MNNSLQKYKKISIMPETIKLNEALSLMSKAKKLQQTDKSIALDKKGNIVAYDATSKKMDNVQRPVTVMRAIPPHPKKGMKYFFHDGYIRFRFPIKWLLANNNQVTIPSYGEWYLLSQIDSFTPREGKKVKNGQIIDISVLGFKGTITEDNTNYLSDKFAITIALKVDFAALVTILNDEAFSIEQSTYKVSNVAVSESGCSLATTSSWYGVEYNKIIGKRTTYPTSLKIGDIIDTTIFTIYKFKKNFPPQKIKNGNPVKITSIKVKTFKKWCRVFKNFNVKNGARMLHVKITTYDYRNSITKRKKIRFKKQAFTPMEAYVYADGENYVLKKIVK